MTDARFPERWLSDRRVFQLSDPAFRLFVTALAWSVSNRTDGELHDDELEMMPRVDAVYATEIGKAGLWERRGDRWLVVEFENTQTTRAVLDALDRQRQHERGKKARQRAHNRGDHSLAGPTPARLSRGTSRGTQRRGQDRRGEARHQQGAEIPHAISTTRGRTPPDDRAAGRDRDRQRPRDDVRSVRRGRRLSSMWLARVAGSCRSFAWPRLA